MKIGIVTVTRGLSYGSISQAYALKTYIHKHLGHKVEFIDFYTEEAKKALYPYLRIDSFRGFFRFLRNLPYLVPRLMKYYKFRQFASANFVRSKRYVSISQLEENPPFYDCYLSGSDQVLRVNKADTLYRVNYLTFCLKSRVNRIVYAGSFGQEIVPEDRVEEVCSLLKSIDHLSCRESEGCDLVKRLIGKDIPFLVDPVNLLSVTEWRSVMQEVHGVKHPYIFVYMLLRHKEVLQIAMEIKRLTGLQVVLLDVQIPPRFKADKNLFNIGLGQFVWLIDNAEYVVTNSFHGTSFSVLFNKNFYSYNIPEPGFITRSRSLLRSIGLEDRIISSAKQVQLGGLSIDYQEPQKRLAQRITESKTYLLQSLTSDRPKENLI